MAVAASSLIAHPAAAASRPPVHSLAARVHETRIIARTVQGRGVVAYRLGTPGGKVVLAVGSIHGNEMGGLRMATLLRDAATIPAGIDLWVIVSANPDGNVARRKENMHGVNLNRNFSSAWRLLSDANSTYSGSRPASEPETVGLQRFILSVKPRMTVWWHGVWVPGVVDKATTYGVARPAVLTAYANVVKFRVLTVSCGAPCSGNATQFGNHRVPGSSAFVVELPSYFPLSIVDAQRHIAAVWAAAKVA